MTLKPQTTTASEILDRVPRDRPRPGSKTEAEDKPAEDVYRTLRSMVELPTLE